MGLQADRRLMKTKTLTGSARLPRQLTQIFLQMIPQLLRRRQLPLSRRRLCQDKDVQSEGSSTSLL